MWAGEANSLNNLGEVYYYSFGKYDEALNFFNQSLAISREISYKEGEWASLDYIGELSADRNQLSKALESYQQALVIIKQLKRASPLDTSLPTSERIRLNNIAAVYFRMGEYDKSLDFSNQYLIEKHTILTAPSIQVLDLTRQRQVSALVSIGGR